MSGKMGRFTVNATDYGAKDLKVTYKGKELVGVVSITFLPMVVLDGN